MQSGKTTSMSSRSIKSESDAHSPSQPPISSPMSISALTARLMDDCDCSWAVLRLIRLGCTRTRIWSDSWCSPTGSTRNRFKNRIRHNSVIAPRQEQLPDDGWEFYDVFRNTMMLNAYLNPDQLRRDSSNSTTSSSYFNMRLADISWRRSQASLRSSIWPMRPCSYSNSSFDDPIPAGSSQRSSSMSAAMDGGPPASSTPTSRV
ncbi:zinc finger protein [Culex quinquefasciatus]|uniref:Zinc finger protein n=2 Tax=Culex quinquefasciatus TaxID=7176 RepID=B0WSK9_CULQU|nr:zinc finger protein [Culex quinquefasciatus]|eukprot:XP_001852918.1 zinc finger protein [Culex quinquefasciatus]